MKKLVLTALAAAAMFVTPASAYPSYSYSTPYYGSSYGSTYGYYGNAYRAPAQYINIGNLDAQPYYGGGYYGGGYAVRPAISSASYRSYSYPSTYSYTPTTYSYPSYSYSSYNNSYPYTSYGSTYGRYIQPASARVISTYPVSSSYYYPQTYSGYAGGYRYGW